MATIQAEILDSFYERLSASKVVDNPTVEALRKLFESGDKLKAEDLVAILARKTAEEVL
jgi:hypothetical protein